MLDGPVPLPVAAWAATVLDEVTKGYVPWSISSITPCAPSKRIRLPFICACANASQLLPEKESISGIIGINWSIIVRTDTTSSPTSFRKILCQETISSIFSSRIPLSDKSPILNARLAILSSYAGPIPRPVVPILLEPRSNSLALSTFACMGRIRVAVSDNRRFLDEILIPWSRKYFISDKR